MFAHGIPIYVRVVQSGVVFLVTSHIVTVAMMGLSSEGSSKLGVMSMYDWDIPLGLKESIKSAGLFKSIGQYTGEYIDKNEYLISLISKLLMLCL